MDKTDYKYVKPILAIIRDVCGNDAFVTGSRMIGGERPMSDVDIVVMVKDIAELNTKLEEAIGPAMLSSYNNGLKFKAPGLGLYVNIIPLHPVDFCAWAWTTDILRASFVCRGASREDRHRKFELGVLAFKTLQNTASVCTIGGAMTWYFNEISDSIKLYNFMDCHDSFIENEPILNQGDNNA